ncbi:DegT/DnrJ/EryC1/StrS family aminotransferase [Oxalobacter sp. OttesenSCG-928-P03]|nr:DegT/DnrJ/EryC1/StrS family aminotransferase [Oxalobacter sp. OttesenSCG-928-P03]
MKEPVFVTRPHIPPLDEFLPYLQQIWDSRVLTNGGPFHEQLEEALCQYLGVRHLSLLNNGTIALMVALKALDLKGEVITTPYSFVATAHSLSWANLKPVFVDICPDTLNIDPAKIEAAITSQTTAIMPVHCYGHPCDVDAVRAIAHQHDLRVVYDAAHAFGVQYKNESVLNFGDLSVLSFHATKVFNTFEGGAIVCHDAEMKSRIDQLKNFGIINETEVIATGLNGKMNEISAAFGLLQLQHIDNALASRRQIDSMYRQRLQNITGIRCLGISAEEKFNYAYFPILVEPDYPISRDELVQRLQDKNIFPRRYFYPLISDFEMYRHLPSADRKHLPVAAAAADRVLCLPIFPDLDRSTVEYIVSCIVEQTG